MSRVSPTPITRQPPMHHVDNDFSLMGNEIFLHKWTFKEGVGIFAETYYTALTDTRLLIRSETSGCCCRKEHSDVSMFLRDIAEMRLTTEKNDCCSNLCEKCCGCCCRVPKHIELRGIFGSQSLHIPKEDMESLQIAIPAAIGNHKLVNRRSFLQ